MIKVLKLAKKVSDKWQLVDPRTLDDSELDGVVILTESNKRFRITEI